MTLNLIKNISFDPAAANMAQVEGTIPTMAFSELPGHAMPAEGLLTG